MASSIFLSFSSSLLPHPLPLNKNSTAIHRAQDSNFKLVHCAFAAPATRTRSTSSSSSETRKRHWKQGEFPGVSETSIPGTYKRAPLKNVKKKLDRKNNAKAWANTVTEALSDAIDKKQWLQALEVGPSLCFSFWVHFILSIRSLPQPKMEKVFIFFPFWFYSLVKVNC